MWKDPFPNSTPRSPMYRLVTLFILLLYVTQLHAQSIFSAIHLNRNKEFKNSRPLQIIETNTFYTSSGKQVDKNIKTFDSYGLIVKEERFDRKGELKARLTFKNDSVRHFKLESTFEHWTTIGPLRETSVYTYNELGFLTRITQVDEKGNIIQMADLIVNDKGHPTELRLFNKNGTSYGKETAEYLYDKNSAVTAVFASDGRLLTTDTIKISFLASNTSMIGKDNYNEHGDALSYTSRQLDGTELLYEVEYVYDEKGNYIDQKIYKVTTNAAGKKRRKLNRHFVKQIIYKQE